jgi:hypothetical protein
MHALPHHVIKEEISNVVINCSVGVYSGGLGPDWAPRQRGRSQEKEQQAGRGGYSINRQKDEAKLICETTTFKVVFAPRRLHSLAPSSYLILHPSPPTLVS